MTCAVGPDCSLEGRAKGHLQYIDFTQHVFHLNAKKKGKCCLKSLPYRTLCGLFGFHIILTANIVTVLHTVHILFILKIVFKSNK